MTTQNYLVVENNVVSNVCVWDGNVNTWQPPTDATMLIQANTNAMIWEINVDKTAFILVKKLGVGTIGFTWDGTVLTTNEPQPTVPTTSTQSTTTGIAQA